MDEHRLTTLLVAASDHVVDHGVDPIDDLRRGRLARRRRRTLVTAAAALGAAAVVALAFGLSSQLTARTTGTKAPTGGGPAPALSTSAAPAETPSSTPSLTPTSLTYTNRPNPGAPAGDQAVFGRLLFDVAQQHLDPAHARMQWSEGFTGSDGGTVREWGRKFAWQAPGEAGQAMVYLAVGNLAPSARLGCAEYAYRGSRKCSTRSLPNTQPADVLDTSTRREVHWSRPDGSYVFVIVDATFGNNSTVATTSALPTLLQMEELVMDPQLVLPPT